LRAPKKKQKDFYSGKKKQHTLKAQVVVARAEKRIICVHTSQGKRHDYQLFKDSAVRVKPQTELVMDSGYQGAQTLHKKTVLPIKKPKGGQLDKEQKCFNKQLAQQRIVNENVIGSIKRFRILAERYRNRTKRYGLRITLVSAIHNWEL
jgi:transposase